MPWSLSQIRTISRRSSTNKIKTTAHHSTRSTCDLRSLATPRIVLYRFQLKRSESMTVTCSWSLSMKDLISVQAKTFTRATFTRLVTILSSHTHWLANKRTIRKTLRQRLIGSSGPVDSMSMICIGFFKARLNGTNWLQQSVERATLLTIASSVIDSLSFRTSTTFVSFLSRI